MVRRDYFSPEEKELYLSLFSDAKRQFSTYVDSGTVLNSESTVGGIVRSPDLSPRLFQYIQPVSESLPLRWTCGIHLGAVSPE